LQCEFDGVLLPIASGEQGWCSGESARLSKSVTAATCKHTSTLSTILNQCSVNKRSKHYEHITEVSGLRSDVETP